MQHLAVGLVDVVRGCSRADTSAVPGTCGVPGNTVGRDALAVVAKGTGMSWSMVLGARLAVDLDDDDEGGGQPTARDALGPSLSAFAVQVVERVRRLVGGDGASALRHRFVCGQSPRVAEGLFGGEAVWWPGAGILERRVPSRSTAPAVEANSAPRLIVVRVEEGDFQVRRQRIKVLGGGAVALFDLGALRDPATAGWATEEAAAARTRMAEAVEEARCRSDQGGVAVDFGVVRTSNDLYLVFGVVGTLRPWWRLPVAVSLRGRPTRDAAAPRPNAERVARARRCAGPGNCRL